MRGSFADISPLDLEVLRPVTPPALGLMGDVKAGIVPKRESGTPCNDHDTRSCQPHKFAMRTTYSEGMANMIGHWKIRVVNLRQ